MHREQFDFRKVRFLSFLSLLLGITQASFLYVLSSYFATVIKNDNVSIFYLIAFGITFIGLFLLRPMIRSFGKIRILSIFLVALIIISAFLSKLPIALLGAGLLIALIIIMSLVWVTVDIILEAYSSDGVSGQVRGAHLTIMNIGVLCGPVISTITIARYGFEGIFSILVIGFSVILTLVLIFLQRENHAVAGVTLRPKEMIRKMWREKDLARIYHVSLSLEFFYATMTIYTPIYLLSLGLNWTEIGTIFTIMLIPFVLLQYPFGWLADNRFGEKELLFGSIVIATLAAFSLSFLNLPSVFLWSAILFFSRIGIAGIEVLRDSYFYKQVDGDDLDMIAFFRTAGPIANIVSAALVIPLLFLFPVPVVFLLVAFVMATSLVSVFFLEDTK